MKHYKPIACYDSAEDIIALFPCDAPKPDMGDIIYKQFREGFGTPRKHDAGTMEETWWDEKEVEEDANFFLTSDKKHGVRLTRGAMASGVPYGYYIDIYALVESTPTIKVRKRKTDEGDRYSISGLTKEQVYIIKQAMVGAADRMLTTAKDWQREGLLGVATHYEECAKSANDIYVALCDKA